MPMLVFVCAPRTKPVRFVICVLCVLLALVRAYPSLADTSTIWQTKVDPTVLAMATTAGETEFFVVLAERADLSAAKTMRTKAEKGDFVVTALRETAARSQRELVALLETLGVVHRSHWISNTLWARGGLQTIRLLALRPDVRSIEAVGTGIQSEPLPGVVTGLARGPDTIEPNLTHVGADQVWALGFTGQGAVVGLMDSGVAWEHPALREQYRGWDPDTSTANHDYNWFVGVTPNATPACLNPLVPCDTSSHGTNVTGTAIGDDGGENRIGIAPGARWIACRHYDGSTGNEDWYVTCMEFMLAPTDTAGNNPNPALAPDVVNNSLRCQAGCGLPLVEALQNLVAAGIPVVVSAGNTGSECSSIHEAPANNAASFGVAATGYPNDNVGSFSGRGPVLNDPDGSGGLKPPYTAPDISAPGVDIRASTVSGGYQSYSGTSMSAPHVAGLIALMISANPDLRGEVELMLAIIRNTSIPRFPTTEELCGDDTTASRPNNVYGWGRIDALAAVQRVTEDSDGDGIADILDNCSAVANPSQCNSNEGTEAGQDAFGNACDADLNDDGTVNSFDLQVMRDVFGMEEPHPFQVADLDCNGVVNSFDMSILRSLFGGAPGPGPAQP